MKFGCSQVLRALTPFLVIGGVAAYLGCDPYVDVTTLDLPVHSLNEYQRELENIVQQAIVLLRRHNALKKIYNVEEHH